MGSLCSHEQFITDTIARDITLYNCKATSTGAAQTYSAKQGKLKQLNKEEPGSGAYSLSNMEVVCDGKRCKWVTHLNKKYKCS